MTEPAILVWCIALAQFAEGKMLWAALSNACEEDRMPSIGGVKRLMMTRSELSPYQPPPPLTEEEQRKSDSAAMLSMLWLHYVHGWEAADFHGEMFKRQFKREGLTPADYLRIAKEAVDEATCRAWMDAREKQDRQIKKQETKQSWNDLGEK